MPASRVLQARHGRPLPSAAEAAYALLDALPRSVWLPALTTACGPPTARLPALLAWHSALLRGRLPPLEADFATPRALQPMRAAVQRLELPALARGVPAVAEQVLRTLCWHLDRLPQRLAETGEAAYEQAAADFADEWETIGAELEPQMALLRSLGDGHALSWDALQGHLRSGAWDTAQRAALRLAQMPQIRQLMAQIGRALPLPQAEPTPPPHARLQAGPQPMAWQPQPLPGAPGPITGVCWSARLDTMTPGEAVLVHHPTLRRLWRARWAEQRLLSWHTEAEDRAWRVDPNAPRTAPAADDRPQPQGRGPILCCLDTSGSMRGAPGQVAKAVALAAVQAAVAQGRGCRILAFGAAGEVCEHEVSDPAHGLDALLQVMAQAFDGGTDVQTPIERAIARVHEHGWQQADVLVVSDGEFGCMPQTLQSLDAARGTLGLRVWGVLIGDRETIGLLELCDHIEWLRTWRDLGRDEAPGLAASSATGSGFSPVHTGSLTALYFPNALSPRAARHRPEASAAVATAAATAAAPAAAPSAASTLADPAAAERATLRSLPGLLTPR